MPMVDLKAPDTETIRSPRKEGGDQPEGRLRAASKVRRRGRGESELAAGRQKAEETETKPSAPRQPLATVGCAHSSFVGLVFAPSAPRFLLDKFFG